jgi:formylglycine-generating enzyme required for sulfatase activity
MLHDALSLLLSAAAGAAQVPSAPAAACPPEMVLVPGATVTLGRAHDPDALAPGARTLRAFCVDRTEVSAARYLACVAAGRCPPAQATVMFPGYGPPEPMRTELSRFCNAARPERAEHPMNCVDAAAAAQYCAWTGGRLPEEEEWEYAARGNDARAYPWGASLLPGQPAPLCWDRRDSALGTCAVGQYAGGASPVGALDMAGNVWEWTASSLSGGRVVRGGGWTNFLARFASATYRWPLPATTRLNCLGFRCVRPLP